MDSTATLLLIVTCVLGFLLVPTQGENFFVAGNAWNTPITGLTADSRSPDIISYLESVGFADGTGFRIDFSFHIVRNGADAPLVPLSLGVPKPKDYPSPDCSGPTTFPMPEGGAIEGQSGYTCDNTNDDCHLLVVDSSRGFLWESYETNYNSATKQLETNCAIVWDLNQVYPDNLRGDQCTSTDAAGFPVAALLFNADEVAAGHIDHAIRFILPNGNMSSGLYVHPATHCGAPSGPSNAPIYGARLRLKPTFNVTAKFPTNVAAQVVATALKTYGMFLSDGGTLTLSAEADGFPQHSWSEFDFQQHTMSIITPNDFEVMPFGTPIGITYDCVRNNETIFWSPSTTGSAVGQVSTGSAAGHGSTGTGLSSQSSTATEGSSTESSNFGHTTESHVSCATNILQGFGVGLVGFLLSLCFDKLLGF